MVKFFSWNIFNARVIAFSVDNDKERFSWMLIFYSFSSLFCVIVILLICQQCFKKINFKVMDEEPVESTNSGVVIEKLCETNKIIVENSNLLMIRPSISHLQQQLPLPITASNIEQLYKSMPESSVFNTISYCSSPEKSIYGQVRRIMVEAMTFTIHTLHGNASTKKEYLFLTELVGYNSLKHANVLKFYGIGRSEEGLSAVFEWCSHGDLKAYMRAHRSTYKDVNSKNLLPIFSTHIATGLHALHQSGFVHRDLALRNCLLTKDLTAKIGDFSQASIVYPEDYMLDDEGNAIAIRWLAPEVINWKDEQLVIRPITMDSNLWSFGVLMWELVTFGAMPYNNMSNVEVLQNVIAKHHIMPLPQVPISNLQQMYKLMRGCWQAAEERISMKEMRLLLLQLLTQHDNEYQPDTSQPFQSPFNLPSHSLPLNLADPFLSFLPNKLAGGRSIEYQHGDSVSYNANRLSSSYTASNLHLLSETDSRKPRLSSSFNATDFHTLSASYNLASWDPFSTNNNSGDLYPRSGSYNEAGLYTPSTNYKTVDTDNIQVLLKDSTADILNGIADCENDSIFGLAKLDSNHHPLT